MATFEKKPFSQQTDGQPIKVANTASTGTPIHTTGTSATTFDEIWLYAYNSDTGPVNLTTQFGGTATPDDDIKITIPSQSGLTLVIPGLILSGTGSAGNTVGAYAQKSASATITNVSATSGTVTYTAANTFITGTTVSINGVNPSAYNLQNVSIASASSTSFTVTNAATGSYVSGGIAIGTGGAANLVTISGYVNRIAP
jgi:hypothetical protein